MNIHKSNKHRLNLLFEVLRLKSFFLHQRYLLFPKPQTGCFHASVQKTDVAGGIFFFIVSLFIPFF